MPIRTTAILRKGSRVTVVAVARRPSLTVATVSAAVAAGSAVAGLALQRRHLRALATNPDLRRLSEPLGGRPLPVVSADGTALHAEVFGPSDGHTIVLAHGWTEQLGFWGPVIDVLVGRGHRVVAYDLRGHGRSDPGADGDYALERFGDDLAAVVEAAVVGGERATVVGHSLGAMSIAAWAGHHDVVARASAAALVNTGMGDLVSGSLLFGNLARWLNHPRLGRALLGSSLPLAPFSSPLSHAVVRYAAFGPDARPGDVAFYERMLLDTPGAVRAACGVALSDMDLWEAVAGLTVPTLVVAGDRDRLTPPKHAREIVEALPQSAGLLVLEQTGHMAPLERPRELADALGELIAHAASSADASVA
jgi:pimeloyl-ACP methyl ester carboxylesterase